MNAGTPDRRNSRLTSELPTLSIFEKHVTKLRLVRCRNSRRMSELPTLTTFEKLAVGLWSSIPDTSGMTRTVNSPNYLNCESSELPTIAGTSDRRNSRHTSELPMNQPENNPFTVTGQIPNTSGIHTGHVRYGQTSNKSVSSFVSQTLKSHMGWLEHLWNIIYQHDASLLIVRHSYLLKFKSITDLNLLSCSFWTEAVYSNLHQVRAPTCWYWSFSLEHSHFEHVTWFHSSYLNNPKCIKSLPSNTPTVIWSFT